MSAPIILPEYPDTHPLWGLNPYSLTKAYEGIECAKCRDKYSFMETMFVNGQPTEEAWCPEYLLHRFNQARVRYQHASYCDMR
jgi:hypothetical protein